MDETSILDKINGWLVAGISAILNLLLITWRSQAVRDMKALKKQVETLGKRKSNVEDCEALAESTEKKIDALFKKNDQIHREIADTRREIKGDIQMVATLIRGGKAGGD